MAIDIQDAPQEPTFSIEQKEGIKLTRNASGIYQWEIKLLELDPARAVRVDEEIRAELDLKGLRYSKESLKKEPKEEKK